MRLGTRKMVDYSFSGLGIFSILLVAVSLVVLLAPITYRGLGAFFFRGTIEHREVIFHEFERGSEVDLETEQALARAARQPVYDMLAEFESGLSAREKRDYEEPLEELKDDLRKLLGPLPGDSEPGLIRDRYGVTRWDQAEIELYHVLHAEVWDYSDPNQFGKKIIAPRETQFEGTSLTALFPYVEENAEAMLRPQWTFYWQFLTDKSVDAHIFGGIWAEMLGTLYLTIGAILFAVPMGIVSAIYLVEYARDSWWLGVLRSCISTLAGVPSIVFGLFGMAFFIQSIHISPSKSVLAGSLTLALLILPIVIRAAEEAIRAVPRTYKEAALSVGASKWRTILTVILPAALPGILTGVVISMGRAAGETAPIIFTAAVSVGLPLGIMETLDEPTPALPWNIYNLCTEHEAADEIPHMQYGMVLTLVALVLLLNGVAIVMRARIARKLTG